MTTNKALEVARKMTFRGKQDEIEWSDESLEANAAIINQALQSERELCDKLAEALIVFADLSIQAEIVVATFKYKGDMLTMSEVEECCPTIGDLRKAAKTIAAYKQHLETQS